MEQIGQYKTLKVIGKGGMGEVLLARDPVCDRNVAIKRIRPDLTQHAALKNRFLREAKITASLTHPGIISIYSIHHEGDETYYTMPYIEGKTLRQIIKDALQNAKTSKNEHSIPALLPIFKSICQTVSYSHSKGVLHRDLKPENILVGTFGEVIVFDWGLAHIITETPQEMDEVDVETPPELTRPGKLVGTVAYMAPERALGEPATVQTDIYALGVMLYQILTLHLPFNRHSLKEFRKAYKHEKLIDPEEMAPYRDVPPRLSRIVKKCLNKDPAKRYLTTEALVHDLMSHMEGRSDWFESTRLNVAHKKDWEFQENVMISKHMAITRGTEAAEWVNIMVSQAAFAENTRLHTRIMLEETGAGIGLLLAVPEAAQRTNPLEGYCLWIGSESAPGVQLFRNTVQVMQLPDVFLKKQTWHTLSLEKIDNNIHFSLDGQLILTYLSYLPLFGTHVGLLARDDDFEMDEMIVSVGSQNLTISCLSIPDAFLADKDYDKALAEYRRIGYSFPGHAEGREALFRAGITLLEQAKGAKLKETEECYSLALEEFGKLHHTPGAPLEYLGKALVYQSTRDHAEEIKCLELGLRRYFDHPLVSPIKEQILYRMHESTQTNRRSAYQLILIVLRLLPDVVKSADFHRLSKHLIKNWERLPFLETSIEPSLLGKDKIQQVRFSIPLAFWLGAPYILLEMYQELIRIKPFDVSLCGDIIFSLYELGSFELAHQLMEEVKGHKGELSAEEIQDLDQCLTEMESLYLCHTDSLETAIHHFFGKKKEGIGLREFRTITYLLKQTLGSGPLHFVDFIARKIASFPLSHEDRVLLDSYRIWAYLLEDNIHAAEEIFDTYPFELLNQEGTLLHPLFGCFLYATEGEEIASIHFAGVIDTPFPRSWALLGHELTNKILESSTWYNTSFMWERRSLYQQLSLFYHCSKNPELAAYYRYLEQQEYIRVSE